MKKKILIIALFLLPLPVFGQALSGINGDCQIEGQPASRLDCEHGNAADRHGQRERWRRRSSVVPSCLVTVYATGTTNKANTIPTTASRHICCRILLLRIRMEVSRCLSQPDATTW